MKAEATSSTVISNWADLVTERTDGRVKFDIFPNKQLFDGRASWEATSTGKVDMSMITPTYYADAHPRYDSFKFPLFFTGADMVRRCWKDGLEEFITEPMEKDNMHYIGVAFETYGSVGTNVRPILLPEDFKGLQIRGFCPAHVTIVTGGGGAVVSMSSSEIYLALEKGTIDGYFTIIESVHTRALSEVTKYWTDATLGGAGAPMSLVANIPVWNSIPADIQKIMVDTLEETSLEGFNQLEAATEDFRTKLNAAGCQVVPLPPENEAAWLEASQPLYTDLEERMGKAKFDELMAIVNRNRS
jgi:TRAP-type C4-dicarboxylate transport system substrate-binding protein